ncbi:Metallo-dependent phosphatase-like protein [Suillus occidentalis]|nr:Metallo-dependent phosphatase-like protein [Suillus occidentalis]
MGPILTQVVSFADVGGYDGQSICSQFLGLCPAPAATALNLTGWFAKPKPNPLPPPKQPSGQLLKVLHLSDMHIDPQANWTTGLCCRENAYNSQSPNTPLLPASRYGSFLCDSLFSLITSVLEVIPPLTGTIVLYDLFKRMLGPGPTYATLGNHDTCLPDLASPSSLGGALGQQFSWLYDHVTALWEQEGWLPEASVESSRTHYAAYMVKCADGLRVISLDTNLWIETRKTRETKWLGWFKCVAEPNQSRKFNLSINMSESLRGADVPSLDRFSPHVIANIFWGHTHEDQLSIFYANNGTNMSAETAQTVSWTGPSVTPLVNLNSGFRVYEVDLIDAYTSVFAPDRMSDLVRSAQKFEDGSPSK